MAAERRLGRGLGSLLGPEPEPEAEGPRSEIPIDRIRPNPHQPRVHFDPAALEELRDSIRRHGILQPLVVRPAADGYHLVAGERRWRAAKLAGLSTVPAVVRTDIGDDQLLELALVENVQREDLDAIEKARGYRRMIEALGLTQEQVAEKVGLRRATVANHLRLLDLPPEAQEAVSRGLISMGHARALIGRPRAEVLDLVERIATRGLSVREVEAQVRAGRPASEGKGLAPEPASRPPWLVELEGRLRARLGAKVRLIDRGAYRGQIQIDFQDRTELERLMDLLAPKRTV